MELSPQNLILINANIITLDPFCPQASWVAIENDKIVALGHGKGWKNLTDKNTGIIDCSGKTVIPGLIDAHLHLVSYAKGFVTPDLSPGKNVHSISDIQSAIKSCSRNRPPGQWIFGRGYNEFYSERCGNSAFCVGFAQGAYERTLKYCKERVQFGEPIAQLQGIRWTLAEMAIKIQAARLLIYDALIKEKNGKMIAKEASMAKKFANEMAVWVCDQAIQLHGAYGYTTDYEVERYYRDVRGWSMGGGTTQVCLNRIAHEILK